MVKAFYVCGVAASVFGVYLDLGWGEARFFGIFERDSDATVWMELIETSDFGVGGNTVYPKRIPGCVNFWASF